MTENIIIDPSDFRLPRTHSAFSFIGSIFHLLFIELPERELRKHVERSALSSTRRRWVAPLSLAEEL